TPSQLHQPGRNRHGQGRRIRRVTRDAQLAVALDAGGELRILRAGALDFRGGDLVQLAVDVRHQSFVAVRHRPGSGRTASSVRSSCSRSRARARRLVNVPIGISSTPAASLYGMPSTSTRPTTTRWSSLSRSIAARIASESRWLSGVATPTE